MSNQLCPEQSLIYQNNKIDSVSFYSFISHNQKASCSNTRLFNVRSQGTGNREQGAGEQEAGSRGQKLFILDFGLFLLSPI
jgi:hypothetical protein